MDRLFFKRFIFSWALLGLSLNPLAAQDSVIQVPDVEIIGVTPLPGTGVPVEDVPSKVQTFSNEDFENSYALDFSSMLETKAAGVTTIEVQNNPFQKYINYRGYTSAPLLGEAQGLAVYQNGVRINEPFGDVMQWDLLPEPALARADLLSSNPVFGLNALGGAIALQLKNGFDFQGTRLNTHTGYFGRHGADIEFGFSGETLAIYAALDMQQDAGWRNRSRSDVERAYMNLGYRGDNLNLSWDFIQADNDLNGNGLAPTELLESNRRAVFTWPDNTENKLLSTGLTSSYFVTDTISVQANAYYRRMFRKTLNADEVEAEACEFDGADNSDIDAATDAGNIAIAALSGTLANRIDTNNGITNAGGGVNFLCEEEEEDGEIEILVDANGLPITEFAGKYAAANTSSTMTKGWGFGVQTEISEEVLGLENKFIIGGSADYGLTRFHQESFLATMTGDRTLLEKEGSFPFINFATLEIEFDGTSVDEVGLQVGEAGPTKLQAHNRYYGLYSTDTFYVGDDLAVTLGGRFNIARITLDDEFETFAPGLITRLGDLNGSHRFARFNPSAGVTYDISDLNLTTYINYAESNRAPSPVELSCADPAIPCRVPNAFAADPPLQQVVSKGWEMGVHGKLDRADVFGITPIDWAATGFVFNNEADIYFISSGVGLGSGYFKNVGGTRRIGGDITLSGQLLNMVGFDTNYSYIQATFESPFSVASESHPNRVNKEVPVEPGDEIPGIPQHTLKIGLSLEPKKEWLIGLDMISRSGMYLRGDEGNFLPRTSGHTIFNVQTSYQVTEYVQLYGLIDNIFDTQYETFGQLGETGDEVKIHELPDGVKEARFLSPGQPFGAFIGLRIRLN